MTSTARLGLPLLDAAQSQKHVTHNSALQSLDIIVHLSVISRDQKAPPANPAANARYLVATGAADAFAGYDKQIAAYIDGVWMFFQPQAGWLAYVEAESVALIYNGSAWQDIGLVIRALDNLSHLGIGTTADATNLLSAKLNSVLFAAKSIAESGTGDLRLTLNKSTCANTVSQLYQTNWSGRAETGLTGDDHFHVKVSADGATWQESINIDPATGVVAFPMGLSCPSGASGGFYFRNRLINASFAINQRAVAGTVTLAAGAYGHDRWKAGASGCTYTFAARGNATTLNITAGSLLQVIEGVGLGSGNYVLSWTGTAQGRIGSGSYGASGAVKAALTSSADTTIEFGMGTLTMPQFEPANTPTSFEFRPAMIETMLCQRYYWLASALPGGWGVNVNNLSASVTFPVAMRATPTIVIANQGIGGRTVLEIGVGELQVSAIPVARLNASGGRFDLTTASASGTWHCGIVEAGFLAFNAEL